MKKQFLLRLTILLTLLGYSRTGWAQLLVLDLIREWSVQAIRQINREIEQEQQRLLMAQWVQRSREMNLHQEALAMVAEEKEAYMALERKRREEQERLRASLRNSRQFKSLILRLESLGHQYRQVQQWVQSESRLLPAQRQMVLSRLSELGARQGEALLRFRWVEGHFGGSWTDEERSQGIQDLHRHLDALYRDYLVLDMEIRQGTLRAAASTSPSRELRSWYRGNGTPSSTDKKDRP